jgi:hypothetical protein
MISPCTVSAKWKESDSGDEVHAGAEGESFGNTKADAKRKQILRWAKDDNKKATANATANAAAKTTANAGPSTSLRMTGLVIASHAERSG